MAVRKYEQSPSQVGRKVRSVAVGQRPAFDGEIVEDFVNVFHVKDSNGQVWRRNGSELTFIKSR